jgi:predicted permease
MLSAQDLRFAFRMMRKKPWFSAAIIITLALGMGVNTTVFSLVNAVLYKPLPFEGGSRIVMVMASDRSNGRDMIPMSFADYRDFRQGAKTFEGLEAFSGQSVTIGEQGNPPDRYRGARISTGMFDMIGTKPVIGRGFLPADGSPGAQQAVLIGYGVWKDRYGSEPGVIGRAVRVNEKPAVIVGVMPEGFKFPNNEFVWLAMVPDAEAEKRTNRSFNLIGKLKENATIADARAELGVIAKRLEKAYPDSNKDHGVSVVTFHEAMNGGPIRLVFLLMLGAVGFVLLIACANVANMLLSRAVERSREVSIRTAMGASRWQLLRQLLVESIVFSAIGGVLGLGLARFGTSAFGRAVENVGKPYWIDFSMDYVVFGYFAVLTLLAGIVFGLAPAVSSSKVNLNETLKEGSRSSDSVRGGYLSGGLVVLQFTLAVVLLSGAGLMIRSFLRAQDEFAGMNTGRVLTGRISLPESRYPADADRQKFFETLMPRLAALPGVRSVAMTSNTPGGGAARWRFEIEGRPVADIKKRPGATAVAVGNGYLGLLGLSLLRGRDFEETDGLPGKEAVIVSQSFAARFFPGQDPVGKQIRLFNSENKARPWMTIVGVAPDLRQRDPVDQSNDPGILVPYRFENRSGMALLLRAEGSPAALTSGLRNAVQQIDRDLPLFDVMALDELLGRQRWHLRVFGTLFLIFAITALGMAAVGIYAVMANATSRRTREIGVRMALGAGVGSILRLVLARGMIQLGLGVILGLAAALLVCQLMGRILFMVSPNDPATFATVVLTLGGAGLAAISIPAQRAARLDPLRALRHE